MGIEGMYYPYFRGKQYDLITLRECAQTLAESNFVPIIEPVKTATSGLVRSIDAISEAGGSLVLIMNPTNGDHVHDSKPLHNLLAEELQDHMNISPGLILGKDESLEDVKVFCDLYSPEYLVTLIHNGFSGAKTLAEELNSRLISARHVFIESQCGISYTKHFKGTQRVLIRNGFERRANREHPELENFSDLHATFQEMSMDGFGDYLIVGDEYSDRGGPAYAVAIHITCIDRNNDDMMLMHHFKSIRYDTPTDPAGKFSEALDKLVHEVTRPNTLILRTSAIEEFLSLHQSGHFPG